MYKVYLKFSFREGHGDSALLQGAILHLKTAVSPVMMRGYYKDFFKTSFDSEHLTYRPALYSRDVYI